MFCDLVGSTALSAQLDPEELREVIGTYHRCVAAAVRRFDGLVAKYMGDGVLVYFGFPRAHEDDAERAARAGLDIVAAVGRLDAPAIPGTPAPVSSTGQALGGRPSGDRLEVRIGIATGLVVVGDLIGEGEALERGVAGETPNLAARLQALPIVTECLVPISFGMALIRKGQSAEGMALRERGIAVWEQSGGRLYNTYSKSVLAEGMAQLGDLAAALHLVDEVIAQIERPGWEERHYYAEALRIKAWLFALKGDPAGAERAYIASLDWARTQQTKSWELRTATGYARLMRDQGRVAEAHELLAPSKAGSPKASRRRTSRTPRRC
jgi:class 3 adenylate cyclase